MSQTFADAASRIHMTLQRAESKNYLRNLRYIGVYEQAVMFLLTVRHNCRNFLIQDVFQQSGEMVSRHFNTVLRAFAAFAKMIKLSSLNKTTFEIFEYMKYYS